MILSRTVPELPFSSICVWLLAQEHWCIEYTCVQAELCHLYTPRFLADAEVDLGKHALRQNTNMMTCQREGVRFEYFKLCLILRDGFAHGHIEIGRAGGAHMSESYFICLMHDTWKKESPTVAWITRVM